MKSDNLNKLSFEELLSRVHPDIKDYLWLGGKKHKRNFDYEVLKEIPFGEVIHYDWDEDENEDPSLLFPNCPVKLEKSDSEEENNFFWNYRDLTPYRRWEYWNFLSDPYNSDNESYLMIFFQGLERFLRTDKYQGAVDLIFKLRSVYQFMIFRGYSYEALIYAGLLHNRKDIILKVFAERVKEKYNYTNPVMFLYIKYILDIPVNAKEVMKLGKACGFKKETYTKGYPEMFEELLMQNIYAIQKSTEIKLKEIISSDDMTSLPKKYCQFFCNESLNNKSCDIPDIIFSKKLQKVIVDLLNNTHEQVKIELQRLRLLGKKPESKIKTKNTLANKSVQIKMAFDSDKESVLLQEYNSTVDNPKEHHRAIQHLKYFYYDYYRKLSKSYSSQCIKYCLEEIAILPTIRKILKSEEIARIKELTDIYTKKEIRKMIIETENKEQHIPCVDVFHILEIVYEGTKEYEKALEICNDEIEYNKGIYKFYDDPDLSYRMARLEKKIKK